MFILANLLNACAIILNQVARLYGIVIFIAILLQWVNADPFNPIVQFLRSVTEPAFAWVRRRMPFVVVGLLDLSPLVVFAGLWLIQLFVVPTLLDIALRLR